MNTMTRFSKTVRAAAGSLVIAALLAACGGGGAGSGGGNGGGSSSGGGNPPGDTTAPQTTIDTAPAATVYVNSVTIAFSANESGATLEGSLDGTAFAAVTSPVTLSSLADGAHSYQVRARDAAGNVDATPATAQWTVLAGPPNTTIDTSPPAATTDSTASFTFSSNKPDSTFEVSLDGDAFAAAQSPLNLTGLAIGAHTIAIRATDNSSQTDPTPAIFNWAVDVTAPTGRILFPTPLSYTDAATLTVRGSAADANGVASVSVNGVAATSIDGFANWRANVPLTALSTTLTLSVTDAAGNTTASADTATVINRGPSLVGFMGMAFDPNGDQIIALDRTANAIYGYRTTDGVGRLISAAPSPGANNGQFSPTAIAVDAQRNRALFIDYQIDSLVAADLATGVRTIVSPSPTPGAATSLAVANDLALDATNNRAFALNVVCNCVIGMDLTTGARLIVASATVGTGAYPSSLNGLVYDGITTPGAPRLLTASLSSPGVQEIIAIDVATGNRSVFSSSLGAIGTGPATQGPMALALDPVRNRLLIADNFVFGIMAIELDTGNRTVLMTQHTGTGPMLYPTTGMAYDPGTNRTFTHQTLENEIVATDLATLARTPLIHSHVGSGAEPHNVDALVIEQPTGAPASLVYSQTYPLAVMRLDLATGARTVIADASTGTGPAIDGISDLVLDTRPSAGPNKALALLGTPGNLLVSIDLITGARTQIADLNAAAPAVTEPNRLRLDVAGNRVLFTNGDRAGGTDALYAIDLATGTRTVISDVNVGSGTDPGYLTDFVFEPAGNSTRVLLSDVDAQSIFSVDLASGDRTLFASPFSGSGEIQFNSPGLLYVDTPNSRLIGMNGGSPANLYSLALSTTEQRLLSGPDLMTWQVRGAGPQAFAPAGMAIDNDRQVVYVTELAGGSLIAIDLVSGDRVIIGD